MSGFLNKDNLPHLVQKLTDGDNIKITGNKHGDRVGKVINKLIDKSNETLGASFKELKNEEYSFKAGEGSGVDLSNSTLDSFTTFALEGNTYKNLVKNGAEELVLNPEIKKEGTGFALDGTFESGQLELEVEGQTLKNFWSFGPKRVYVSKGQVNTLFHFGDYKLKALKIGETYSFKVAIQEELGISYVAYLNTEGREKVLAPSGMSHNSFSVGAVPDDFSGTIRVYLMPIREMDTSAELLILEGDYTQKEAPTFIEGVQGVGRKSKNLLNFNNIHEASGVKVINKGNIVEFEGVGISSRIQPYFLIDVKNMSKITIKGELIKNGAQFYLEVKDNEKGNNIYINYGHDIDHQKTFDVSNVNVIKVSMGKHRTDQPNLILKNLQLEEGNHATLYEPYFEGYKIGVNTYSSKPNVNELIEYGRVGNDGALSHQATTIRPINYISVEPNTKYKVVWNTNLSDIEQTPSAKNMYFYFIEYTKEGEVAYGNTSFNGAWLNDKKKSIEITTREKANLVKFRFEGLKPNLKMSDIKMKIINLKTMKTIFSTYNESTSEIILQDQLQGIGDAKDRLYFDNGYKVERNFKEIKLSDIKNWTEYHRQSEGYYCAIAYDRDLKLDGKVICNLLDHVTVWYEGNAREGIEISNPNGENGIVIKIKNERLKGRTIEDFKNWLTESGIYGAFQLVTPKIINTPIKTEMSITTFNTKTYIAQDSGVKGNLKISNKGYKTYNLLPNKEYTVMIDKEGNSPITLDLCGVKKVIDGDKGTISTSTNNIGELRFYGNKKVKNIRLLEGKVVNKGVGYFEGVQGVGEKGAIKARACGKNLFCVNDEILKNGSIGYFNGKKCLRVRDNSGKPVIFKNKSSKPGLLTLTIHFYRPQGLEGKLVPVCFVYKNGEKHIYHNRPINETITLTSRENSVLDNIYIGWNFSEDLFIDLEKTQVELGESTPYEPYEESDFSIELEEPLMRLPSGVCDEITKDGKLIRRVGKIKCSEIREKYGISPSTIPWSANSPHAAYQWTHITDVIGYHFSNSWVAPNLLSDQFSYGNHYHGGNPNAADTFFGISNDKHLRIMIRKTLIKPEDPNSVNYEDIRKYVEEKHPEYLETVIYYELAQPIITDIKPLQARLFKNGHVIFDNKIAPVSTYEVAVNKPAQINAGIKETQKLENRVNALEGLYDSMLLENSHILSNLEFDFSLMKEVEE